MLIKQALDGRVRARAGLYQAGGAYGFRDQLQDMLVLMHYEPARAREHILRAAARQFEAGDVMHWWHMPYMGVRTHISDDRLFLPFVTAAYVGLTGDRSVCLSAFPICETWKFPRARRIGTARARFLPKPAPCTITACALSIGALR